MFAWRTFALVSVSAASILFGLAPFGQAAAQDVRHECSEKYQAAKAAGTLNGDTWPQFYSKCTAEARDAAAAAGSAAAPAPPDTRHICSEKYQAAKAADTLNGEAWPQFFSRCTAETKANPPAATATPAPAAVPAPPAPVVAAPPPLAPLPVVAAPAPPPAAAAPGVTPPPVNPLKKPATKPMAPAAAAPAVSFVSCQAGGAAAPSFFPWPPPQGSDEQDFTGAVVGAIHKMVKDPVRLKSVDLFLRDRLQRVGHSSITYFSTPHRDGYAAITRLEQIDKTGHFLEGSARFTKDAAESANLIYKFVEQLVSLPEGRFRLLVFFVSSDPTATQYTTTNATLQDADRWVGQGCASLPPQLAELRLTDRHKVLLRVFEFVSKGSDSHLISRAEAIPLAQHLSALGLKLDVRK